MSTRDELAAIIDDTPPVPDGDGGLTDWVIRQNLAAADAIIKAGWVSAGEAVEAAAEAIDGHRFLPAQSFRRDRWTPSCSGCDWVWDGGPYPEKWWADFHARAAITAALPHLRGEDV